MFFSSSIRPPTMQKKQLKTLKVYNQPSLPCCFLVYLWSRQGSVLYDTQKLVAFNSENISFLCVMLTFRYSALTVGQASA